MFRTIEFENHSGIAAELLGNDFSFDPETKKANFKNQQNTVTLTLNRRIIKFNNIKIWLYNPVIADSEGDLRISKTDYEKILKILLSPGNIQKKTLKRIILDPGHGNEDAGAVGKKFKEKDINLALALRIKKSLESAGFEVIMTRNDDTFLPLAERSDFAAKNNADLFISIHHNAAKGNPVAHGIETYSLTAAGNAGTHDNGKNATSTHERRGNKFDNENILLNYLVQSNMISATKSFDRGVKFARYQVLVQAPCPAILIEAGFISNPQEELLINSPDRQTQIADAVTQAVMEFNKKSADR